MFFKNAYLDLRFFFDLIFLGVLDLDRLLLRSFDLERFLSFDLDLDLDRDLDLDSDNVLSKKCFFAFLPFFDFFFFFGTSIDQDSGDLSSFDLERLKTRGLLLKIWFNHAARAPMQYRNLPFRLTTQHY